tara:strand:+ start:859 stop:1644 length:786 start_codon:yes stop_codon:yes gene_type:complete
MQIFHSKNFTILNPVINKPDKFTFYLTHQKEKKIILLIDREKKLLDGIHLILILDSKEEIIEYIFGTNYTNWEGFYYEKLSLFFNAFKTEGTRKKNYIDINRDDKGYMPININGYLKDEISGKANHILNDNIDFNKKFTISTKKGYYLKFNMKEKKIESFNYIEKGKKIRIVKDESILKQFKITKIFRITGIKIPLILEIFNMSLIVYYYYNMFFENMKSKIELKSEDLINSKYIDLTFKKKSYKNFRKKFYPSIDLLNSD